MVGFQGIANMIGQAFGIDIPDLFGQTKAAAEDAANGAGEAFTNSATNAKRHWQEVLDLVADEERRRQEGEPPSNPDNPNAPPPDPDDPSGWPSYIPRKHSGGNVNVADSPYHRGSEGLFLLKQGETVLPPGGGGAPAVNVEVWVQLDAEDEPFRGKIVKVVNTGNQDGSILTNEFQMS